MRGRLGHTPWVDWALAGGAAALAFCTSFLNGFLGAGGGLVLVSAFIFALPLLAGRHLGPHAATALSTVAGTASGIGAPLAHRWAGRLDLSGLRWLGPSAGVGALAGAAASALLPGRALLVLYSVVTLVAIPALLLRARALPEGHGRMPVAAAACVGVGVLGGAIGVGSAFLLIPVLTVLVGQAARTAMASGMVLGLFLVVPAAVGKSLTGQMPFELAPLVFLGALAGSALGALAASRVPEGALRGGLIAIVALATLRTWAEVLRP